ncbi:MAG: hypothetical protein JOZ01_07240, partial [Candidatus Eremiobacteraeota bacterium]|nr:hypothetical protein [Candidatus Eremiobacteraeota bacterium]
MKRSLPLVAAGLGLLVFFVLYFSPAEFGKVMASGDAVVESIPALFAPRNLWEPGILLGYPLFADPNQQQWYPLAWLVHPFPHAFNAYAVAPFVLAAFGMTGFVRLVTRSTAAGIVAGLVYALGGFMISHASHLMISHPAAWSPFVLWALESARRRRDGVPIVAGAVALGLCGDAGQPQVFVFTVTLAIAYTVALAWVAAENERWRFVARGALLLGVGAAFACPALIPAAMLGHDSTRAALGAGQFTALEIPPDQLIVRMLFPYVFGGSPMPWFAFGAVHIGEFTEQTIAVGSVALTLALLARHSLARDRRVIFWYAIAAVALVLAIGDATPLAAILHAIPVYDLLRIPARHAFEWTIAIAVLAGYGTAAIVQARVQIAHVIDAFAIVAIIAGGAYLMLVAGHPSVVAQIVALYGANAARSALSP